MATLQGLDIGMDKPIEEVEREALDSIAEALKMTGPNTPRLSGSGSGLRAQTQTSP